MLRVTGRLDGMAGGWVRVRVRVPEFRGGK